VNQVHTEEVLLNGCSYKTVPSISLVAEPTKSNQQNSLLPQTALMTLWLLTMDRSKRMHSIIVYILDRKYEKWLNGEARQDASS